MKKFLLLLLIPFFSLPTYGTHLAGGSIRVICVGGNQFKIQVVRNTESPGGGFPDGTVQVNPIGAGATQSHELYGISANANPLPPPTTVCLAPAPLSTIAEHVFETAIITINPGTRYTIYYIDNNRNSTNTLSIQDTMVLYAEFPDPGISGCNNSPIFQENPPMLVCLDEPLYYDGSAVDPDGDSLLYRLCSALKGTTPPFSIPTYATGYSGNYPISSNPPVAIDQHTGVLSGTPNMIGGFSGRWTLNYCVDEYRNGVKIGQYNREVQMTVTNCTTQVAANIEASYNSVALGMDVIASCDDYTVAFSNTTNGGVKFFWDFGVPGISNDTSNLRNPTYTYPDTGVYLVKLIVNEGFVCVDTITKTVIVYPGTIASFAHSQSLCEAEPISFTDQSTIAYGLPIYWRWQFGDGDTSVLQNPVHLYDSFGSYYAQLMLESSKGCRDTVWEPIHIGLMGLGADTSICGTQHVLDIGNPPGNILWSTGAQTQQITVMNSGTYSVTVSDGTCTVSDSVEVTFNPNPTLYLGPDIALCQGDAVQLFGNLSGNYTWSTGATTNTISVMQGGLYSATVTDSNGCADSDTVKVNVFPLPTDILGPDFTACDSVTLNASGGVSYLWQDGSSGSTHEVMTTGTYAVTATDINGCSNAADINVTINESTQAGFSFDTTNCPDVSFTNLSSGTNPLYFWDFGDGAGSSTGLNPSYTFGSNGLYVVELTASNMCDTNSVSDTVGIDCYPDGIVNPKGSVWRIYPNPASTVLYLEHLQPMNHQTEVSITNTIGQQLLKKRLNGAIVGLNIQHLPPGMYFLEFLHNGERQVLPVSIIR